MSEPANRAGDVLSDDILERAEQYHSVFEATTDGLIILEMDGTIVEANRAYCDMVGYTRDKIVGRPIADFVHPDEQQYVPEGIKAVGAGGSYSRRSIGLRSDGTPLYADSRGILFTYRGCPHILGVIRDITEQVEAERELREKEEQYRSVFEAAIDAVAIVSATGKMVEVNPAFCAMYGYARDELIDMDATRLVHPDDVPRVIHAVREVFAGGTVELQARGIRKDGSSFYSWGRGTIFQYRGEPHFLGISRDVTERVEAYELLEQRVEERTRELSTLLEISRTVASTLELEPLLDVILDQLNLVADNDGIALLEVRGDEFVVLLRRIPGHEEGEFPRSYSTQSHGPIWDKLRGGEVVIIGDVRGDDPLARAYRTTVGDFLNTSLSFEHSFMAVPLMLKDRIIGLLGLTSARSDYYTRHHGEIALAIAQQAAVAIENARLYQKAQDAAVLEERQRLARELHDSVSQALYGIALGARTTATLLERNPSQAVTSNDYVLSLAETGLAEMRALIFELRPESLEKEGLVGALQKQAEALHARHRIPVTCRLAEEPAAPLPVKEALYRIAQEAMNNAVKHADATQIELTLEHTDGRIAVQVCDDGRGFDPSASFPGHLGLQSMKERAGRIGGTVELESAPGAGTRVRACIPSGSPA